MKCALPYAAYVEFVLKRLGTELKMKNRHMISIIQLPFIKLMLFKWICFLFVSYAACIFS